MIAYSLVPAAASDLAFLQGLHHATMRPYVEKIWGWDDAEQDQMFRRAFQPEKISLIRIGEENAGMLSIEDRPEEIFITTLLIAPAYQSAGIGGQILREIMAGAEARSLPVTLTVLQSNLRAQALYKRLGFVVAKEDDTRQHLFWRRS